MTVKDVTQASGFSASVLSIASERRSVGASFLLGLSILLCGIAIGTGGTVGRDEAHHSSCVFNTLKSVLNG